MSNLYEKITELCRQNGISGSRLCLESGVSKSLLTELKSGRTKSINFTTAQKFANRLGVSVDTLLDDSELTPVEQIQDELQEKRNLLFSLTKKASEEDLDKFIKMLELIMGDKK